MSQTVGRGVVRMVMRKMGRSGVGEAWVLMEKWPGEDMREIRTGDRDRLIGLLDTYR